MIIKCITSGPFETNGYVVLPEKGGKGCLIDAPPGIFPHLLEFLGEREIEALYLTHSHFDHIGDAKEVQEKLKIPVYVHQKDAENMVRPGSDGIPDMLGTKPLNPDFYLTEGDMFSVGESKFSVIETPGHSPGGICFYSEGEEALFSGDTLFKGTYGNISFPTSNREEMLCSLKRLIELPNQTRVYPGHGEVTTIEEERGWICRL